MQNLSKSILAITAIWSLLLNIFLIFRFSVNFKKVIYTGSSEWFADIREKDIGKLDFQKRNNISDRYITNISDNVVPCPNHTLYLDNLKQNMKQINVRQTAIEKPLSDRVSVLCLVMTQPKNLRTRAVAVKNTWGRRCNKLLFISSVADKQLPALGFNTAEGYQHLWLKTRAAFKYIYENHFNDTEWFYKGDDDTYVITENLRFFLSKYNPSEEHFFGRHIINNDGNFQSGGAGYVFTRKVLKAFYEVMKDPKSCKETSTMEDVELAKCLQSRNIFPKDSKDFEGKQIFHHYEKADDNHRSSHFSNETVSFHYIPPNTMYEFEFMLYRIKNKL